MNNDIKLTDNGLTLAVIQLQGNNYIHLVEMRVGNTLDNLQDETEWTLKMISACQTLLNEALPGMLG